MAKEVIQGEVVEVLEDDGPEEGEIEDDSSDEDNVENYGLCPSNSTQVNTTIGSKYYQPPCTSSGEVHSLKSQLHSEEKTEKCWGNSGRRHYKFYVDHDKPSRESYNRLKKSDLNSDHRGINFHELLIDYKTSKHGNEGNTHEKENRHYAKEVRVDSSRKRESGVNDVPVEKIKRSRKRKHRRSPSRSPVSSETDVGRRKKDLRTSRPKRKKKLVSGNRNCNESAALFAQIRASKLNLTASEQKKSTIEVINVVSEGENTTEVSETYLTNRRPVVSEGEGSLIEKNIESQTSGKESEGLRKEPTSYDCNKCLSTASDSQTAEKVEDSESKDEDDDDVNQLRMIALQSAFRAKYLARKRRGLSIRKQYKKTGCNISTTRSNMDSIFNLDDTSELLEAAVEEAVVSSQNKETSPLTEPAQSVLCTSLSEVPLPPDEPQTLPTVGPSLIEDLTPVDMELALTDEEENTGQVKGDDSDAQYENSENMHPKVRVSRYLTKTRNIPVTIGRNQHFKARQRSLNNDPENSRRSNLLEVITSENDGLNVESVDSSCVTMEDMKMGSMIVLDAVGTCSSPEVCQVLEEDQTLSEASDAKSDFIPPYISQCCMSGNDNDDEDEELLRARLLLDISSRHRKEESITMAALAVEDTQTRERHTFKISTHNLVRTVHTEAIKVNSQIKLNGKSSVAPVASVPPEKIKTPSKKNMERLRKGLLVKAHDQGTGLSKQYSIMPFVKGRASKISNRGKYQRINQNRLAMVKKRPDGNLQVTVPCSSTNTKVVSQIPQQQDRIVICLGEDSDESEDEKQKNVAGEAPAAKTPALLEQSKPADSISAGNVSIDFEKSVDLFLKEVRSVQESKSKNIHSASSATVEKVETMVQPAAVKPKIAANTPKTHPAKPEPKPVTGITPQAVRHLPFPQQEEYRRLKMKISILEEKKRKTVEASQALPKNDQKSGLVGSTPVLNLPDQTELLLAPTEKKSDVNESSNPPSSLSLVSSNSLTKQTKAVVEINNTDSKVMSEGGNDDDNEDENLMREQLLRSRLRKRAAAMAEVSSPKTENFPVKDDSIPSKTVSVSSEPECSAIELNSKTEINSSKSDAPSLSTEVSLLKESIISPKQEVVTSMEVVTLSNTKVSFGEKMSVCDKDDASKENGIHSVIEETSCIAEASKDKKTQLTSEEVPSTVKVIPSKGGGVTDETASSKNMMDSANDGIEVKLVTDAKEDVSKTKEVSAHSETKVDGTKTEAGKTCQALAPVSCEPVEIAKHCIAKPKLATNQENSESRASQLMELEFQLLSERHAALKYLSELSQLLNKMETEGNRLKEKEVAVKKLKAELSLAEAALYTQKSFMKQLALNVSSTHARVTATRQKCTMLSRACLKLGNQVKQDEIANGGKKTIYKVPTGGAELVKSQLSSVLCHTKQLKKSGLPFLGLSQEFIGKEEYSVKKPGKRFIQAHVQPLATQWAKISMPSERLNLKIEKKNPTFVSSKFVKPVKASTSLTKDYVVHNAVSNFEPVVTGVSLSSVVRTLSVTKSAVTLPKLGVSTKSTLAPKTSSITSNQTSKNEVHVSDSVDKPAKVVSTSTVTTAVSSVPKECASNSIRPVTSVSSFTLVPSVSSKNMALESGAGKAIQLDYHSPLEPISRTCSENSTTVVSSASSRLECEDSVMLDPNIMLCPYDLMGVCQDEECIYQHQRRKVVVKES